MKKTLTFLFAMLLFSSIIYAQDGSARTKEFSLDFTAKKTITIDMLFPSEVDTLINYREIVLKVGYNVGGNIKDMSLLLNGVPLSTDHRGIGFTKRDHPEYQEYIEHEITLNPGGNVIKFAIRDDANNIEIIERTIVVAENQNLAIINRKDYAILFAIDQYEEWAPLTNPVNDVQTIASDLEEFYGFQTEVVTNSTRDDIIIKLREYARKSYNEHDQLLIFFAGHGQYDDIMGQGYIVTKDSKLSDPAKGSYIAHSVLRGIIDNIPTEHTLLVMDVCFGGTFDPLIARSSSRGQDTYYDEVETSDFIKRKHRYKTRKYITSGGKEYVPDGRPGMHSPFAGKFLEALRSNGGRDNIITLPELYGWLERISPEPRVGGFGTDQPGSDFVFVHQEK